MIPHKILIVASILVVAGCSSTPPKTFNNLTQRVEQLQQDEQINRYAPVELEESREQLAATQKAWESSDTAAYNHEEYLTQRYLDITEKAAELGYIEDQLAQASAERDDLLLKAREQEAQAAQRKADKAKQQLAELQAEMENIKAEQTARGLVLTMSDVLFSFDQAELQPGGERTIEKLAKFLQQNPATRITVEGFTDSTGSSEYNLQLSHQRAKAVVEQLKTEGIADRRIDLEAYGEQYPVASNDSKAGRQQNRRVQMVLSEKDQHYLSPGTNSTHQ